MGVSQQKTVVAEDIDKDNDSLIAVSLQKGKICLMSFNMTNQQSPVETQGKDQEKDKYVPTATGRSKQPKMGEKIINETPCLIHLSALNSKFNDATTPTLVNFSNNTFYMYTNDGVLALFQINFDNVQSRQADNQITMAS